MPTETLQDFGPYRIVERIATGGMAEIYLARQRGMEGLERDVILKRILAGRADDDEFITMFLDEARLLAALSHPHIAQVFDLGQVEGAYYLSMEYIRGPTLGRLLASVRAKGERLPRREALGIGLAIAEALHYVHERRDEVGRSLDIVHRDLNPANVLVSYDGAVKLIDFGIAKAATKVYETRAGVIKGTYGYIAPEQLIGTTKVDRRADVFALGILLYEMCVGAHPFDVSDEPNLIDRILEARYRRPRDVQSDIPRDLDRLIASCLTPHPEGRPDDVGVLIEALAKHLGEQGMVPTQSGLAHLARTLVPDDAGPKPLRQLTSQMAARRPFAAEPGGTRKLALGRPKGESTRKTEVARPSQPPLEPWRDVDDLDDEPLTIASVRDDLTGTEAMLSLPAPDAHLRADAEEEEAPTRLMSLDDPRISAPPPAMGFQHEAHEETYVPVERRARRRFPVALAAGIAAVSLGALGAGAFFAMRAFRADPAPERTLSTIAPVEVAVDAGAPEPATLRVISEPPGATVSVDGELRDGVTPMELELASDTRQVWMRLSLDGFIMQEREVSAAVGEARFVLRPMELDAGPLDAGLEDAGQAEVDAGRPTRRRRRRARSRRRR